MSYEQTLEQLTLVFSGQEERNFKSLIENIRQLAFKSTEHLKTLYTVINNYEESLATLPSKHVQEKLALVIQMGTCYHLTGLQPIEDVFDLKLVPK